MYESVCVYLLSLRYDSLCWNRLMTFSIVNGSLVESTGRKIR